MVICFEEKDRATIEAKGMTIIEFKHKLYKMEKIIDNAWHILKEVTDELLKVWNVHVDKFLEAADSVKLILEAIREVYHCPTSHRYRIVKVFSKCTGMDIRFCWKITWKMKRWLARSLCGKYFNFGI